LDYYAELVCVLQRKAILMVFDSIDRADYHAYEKCCRRSKDANRGLASADMIRFQMCYRTERERINL